MEQSIDDNSYDSTYYQYSGLLIDNEDYRDNIESEETVYTFKDLLDEIEWKYFNWEEYMDFYLQLYCITNQEKRVVVIKRNTRQSKLCELKNAVVDEKDREQSKINTMTHYTNHWMSISFQIENHNNDDNKENELLDYYCLKYKPDYLFLQTEERVAELLIDVERFFHGNIGDCNLEQLKERNKLADQKVLEKQ